MADTDSRDDERQGLVEGSERVRTDDPEEGPRCSGRELETSCCFSVLLFFMGALGYMTCGAPFLVTFMLCLLVYFFLLFREKTKEVYVVAFSFFTGFGVKGLVIIITIFFPSIYFLSNREQTYPVPSSVGVLAVRVFVGSFFMISLAEELLKFIMILSFDQEDTGERQLWQYWRLNIYNPRYVIFISMGVSLGATALDWEIAPQALQISFHRTWPYEITLAILKSLLAVSTGALLGVGIARRLFLQRQYPIWRILLAPWLLRGTFFFFALFPMRSEQQYRCETIWCRGLTVHNTLYMGALAFLGYLINAVLVVASVVYARWCVNAVLEEEKEDSKDRRRVMDGEGEL